MTNIMQGARYLTALIVFLSVCSQIAVAGVNSPPKLGSGIVLVQVSGTEERLASVIEDLRSGSPNMNQFEPMLRIAVQQQESKVTAYLQQVGQVRDIAFVGSQNGGDVYKVTFQRGVSAWMIQIAPDGTIAVLYFQ